MRIELGQGMDQLITWKARIVFVLVDRMTGEDYCGIPPQSVSFTLQISVRSFEKAESMMFNHGQHVFEGLLEDFKSKYPDNAFDDPERLLVKAMPIYVLPVISR